MANKDKDQFNEDEYHFDDLDALNPPEALNPEVEETLPGEEAGERSEERSPPKRSFEVQSNVKRNAIIAVGIFFLSMLIYKLVSSYMATHPQRTNTVSQGSTVSVKKITPPPTTPVTGANVNTAPAHESITETTPEMRYQQELSRVEQNQQNVVSDVMTINSKLTDMTTNVETMVTRMNELNRTIEQLSAKVSEQSQVIEHLMQQKHRQKKHKIPARRAVRLEEPLKLYLQAIIPGRAWLVATNGATLTVRKGSMIKGYGMVTSIDPIQGRVTTSSGQVIRFSQADS